MYCALSTEIPGDPEQNGDKMPEPVSLCQMTFSQKMAYALEKEEELKEGEVKSRNRARYGLPSITETVCRDICLSKSQYYRGKRIWTARWSDDPEVADTAEELIRLLDSSGITIVEADKRLHRLRDQRAQGVRTKFTVLEQHKLLKTLPELAGMALALSRVPELSGDCDPVLIYRSLDFANRARRDLKHLIDTLKKFTPNGDYFS